MWIRFVFSKINKHLLPFSIVGILHQADLNWFFTVTLPHCGIEIFYLSFLFLESQQDKHDVWILHKGYLFLFKPENKAW